MRVRGLKLAKEKIVVLTCHVAPRAGAWIETRSRAVLEGYEESSSHPVRVRGLKLIHNPADFYDQIVAPRAGAWIETEIPTSVMVLPLSRTPCGCVD